MALKVEDLHLAFERIAAIDVGLFDDAFSEEIDSVNHVHSPDE